MKSIITKMFFYKISMSIMIAIAFASVFANAQDQVVQSESNCVQVGKLVSAWTTIASNPELDPSCHATTAIERLIHIDQSYALVKQCADFNGAIMEGKIQAAYDMHMGRMMNEEELKEYFAKVLNSIEIQEETEE